MKHPCGALPYSPLPLHSRPSISAAYALHSSTKGGSNPSAHQSVPGSITKYCLYLDVDDGGSDFDCKVDGADDSVDVGIDDGESDDINVGVDDGMSDVDGAMLTVGSYEGPIDFDGSLNKNGSLDADGVVECSPEGSMDDAGPGEVDGADDGSHSGTSTVASNKHASS